MLRLKDREHFVGVGLGILDGLREATYLGWIKAGLRPPIGQQCPEWGPLGEAYVEDGNARLLKIGFDPL